MTWQLAAVSVIVTAAAAYLVRQTWRTWNGRKAGGCGGGCGCSSKQPGGHLNGTAALIPSEQITLRRRQP